MFRSSGWRPWHYIPPIPIPSARLCYAMTINKSQGQTLKRVGLDLRGDVFCHGQLHVAWSRTTCRDNLLCLVKPERRIDGIPYVPNVVYSEIIVDAAGHAPPIFDIDVTREIS